MGRLVLALTDGARDSGEAVRCHGCGQLVARRWPGALVLIGVEPLCDEKPDDTHIRVRCPSCRKRIRLDIAA